MLVFRLPGRTLFAKFLSFLCLLCSPPVAGWDLIPPQEKESLRAGESRDMLQTWLLSGFYRAWHWARSLFQVRNVFISVTPPPIQSTWTLSTLLNLCESFKVMLVLGKLWNASSYVISSPATESKRRPSCQQISGRISERGRETCCWLMSSDHITEAIAYLTC